MRGGRARETIIHNVLEFIPEEIVPSDKDGGPTWSEATRKKYVARFLKSSFWPVGDNLARRVYVFVFFVAIAILFPFPIVDFPNFTTYLVYFGSTIGMAYGLMRFTFWLYGWWLNPSDDV